MKKTKDSNEYTSPQVNKDQEWEKERKRLREKQLLILNQWEKYRPK